MTIKETLEQSIADNWTTKQRGNRVYTVADVIDAMDLGLFSDLHDAPATAPALIRDSHNCLMSDLQVGDGLVMRNAMVATVTLVEPQPDGRTKFALDIAPRPRTWSVDGVWVRRAGKVARASG